MVVQAGGIWLTVGVPEYAAWLVGAALQGLGTAMVYPTLLAAITDHAHPTWRASSLGVYRFWRDLGYAIGALLSGLIADAVGLEASIHVVAALTLLSGGIVGWAMRRPAPVGATLATP
jgi:MFS family permease